ncbi:hypothetical protein GNI_155320 [Gregarina niphandrodes]|uniref:Uncharacterized protein n=1 Tax=Gregarina niphandrodes TaxID=110365 RepID=A0A023AZM6_GRENI|nr:hypothetical protein GNI_155320 [Gregarina niphandrodes]EZG43960.1 hypothetical protein GNI_155320 [Gregarina niphandrodes]|eukprot:XP_011132879.1 hypothetical protein GNI_155320 [Gregarina niphandrodes]
METRSNSLIVPPPPVDTDAKQKDKVIIEGSNVNVNFNLVDSDRRPLQTLTLKGTEVAKVKRQLREATGYTQMEFRYNDK